MHDTKNKERFCIPNIDFPFFQRTVEVSGAGQGLSYNKLASPPRSLDLIVMAVIVL